MDNNSHVNKLKQVFILELMAFSPKYNAVLAEEIANQLSDQELIQLSERLSKLNHAYAEELADLEENDAEEYEQVMKERGEEEKAVDDAFFKQFEEKMLANTEEVEKGAKAAEEEIDTIADEAEEEINKEYDGTEKLLDSFFEDVEKAQAEQKGASAQPQEKPDMSLSDVKNELHLITEQQDKQANEFHDPTEEAKRDNWQ